MFLCYHIPFIIVQSMGPDRVIICSWLYQLLVHNKRSQNVMAENTFIDFAHDCAGQKYELGVCWVLFLVLAGLLYEFVVSSCQL